LVNSSDATLELQLTNQAMKRGSVILGISPTRITSFDAQVGGVSFHKESFRRLEGPYVLKPLRQDHRKIREIAFYELVNDPLNSTTCQQSRLDLFCSVNDLIDDFFYFVANIVNDQCVLETRKLMNQAKQRVNNQRLLLSALSPFLPEYFGVAKLTKDMINRSSASFDEDTEYIILEDLTKKYSKPCIIDVKLGTQSYEPDATDEKKRREAAKYPQQTDFGLRIVAMRVYNPSDTSADKGGFTRFSKHDGRSLSTRGKVKDAFRKFFGVERPSESITLVLQQLQAIEAWFLGNDSFCFYSSSIMIVYEGDNRCKDPSPATAKMIDFARVRKQRGGDKGYRVGLRTLMTVLQEIKFELIST